MKPAEKRKAQRAHDAAMRIISYVSSVQDEAPENMRCLARIICGDGEVLATDFRGPTKQAVREAAQAWWDAEIARLEQAEANRIKAASAREAKRAAQPNPVAA